jgi:hypothetical protein
MPRYFYQLTDGKQVLKTPRSLELPGNAAAREEALVLARELKEGKILPGRKWDGWFVEIIDHHGHRVDSVPIAVAPEEPWQPFT